MHITVTFSISENRCTRNPKELPIITKLIHVRKRMCNVYMCLNRKGTLDVRCVLLAS